MDFNFNGVVSAKETTQTTLSDYLSTFNVIVSELRKRRDSYKYNPDSAIDNIVIGGTVALELHGIKVPRPPQDLDFVIYSPTDAQLEYMEGIRIFHLGSYNSELAIKQCKSFMFKRRGLLLNIVLEHAQQIPSCDLHYKHGNNYFMVQPVDKVIDAKNSYRLNPHTTSITGMRFIRAKDAVDCMQMKNLNFNIPLDGDVSHSINAS